MEAVDICIVGSGFGGSVSAARLSEICLKKGLRAKIRLLERGHDFFDFDRNTLWKYRNAQGNGFKQTLRLDYLTEISDVCTNPFEADLLNDKLASFTIAMGKGVGGGSLVYYAASLRAPRLVFEQTENGRRLWPEVYARQTLEPYYARAEQMLKVCRLAWSTREGAADWQLCTKRDYVFAKGCLQLGLNAEPLKVATQNDVNEGWWVTGQRFSGRQHLPLNYLPLARTNGVDIHSECEVESVAPDGRGYAVTYFDKRTNERKTLASKLVIVAGGTVGSTLVLLKSRKYFTGARALSETLGRYVSSNGDYGLTGMVGPEHQVEGYKGKPMSSICASFWNDHQYNLIPFYAPPLMLSFGQPAELVYPRNPAAVGRASTTPDNKPLWGKSYKDTLKLFGDRVLTVGILTLDKCEGVIEQAPAPLGHKAICTWRETHPETEHRWNHAVSNVRRIFNALGGELFTDYYRYRGQVGTVHPLGGCRMAPTRELGVVNHHGEVFDNPNLFVLDAAIIPTALAVNPSLTIAALTEYVSEAIGESLEQRLAS